jgi:hypothetical protein
LIYPRSLKHVFVGLSLITLPIGLLVSEIVLLLSFFGLFLPVALAFRLLGRDALQRRLEPAAASYWQRKPTPAGVASYLRQS